MTDALAPLRNLHSSVNSADRAGSPREATGTGLSRVRPTIREQVNIFSAHQGFHRERLKALKDSDSKVGGSSNRYRIRRLREQSRQGIEMTYWH